MRFLPLVILVIFLIVIFIVALVFIPIGIIHSKCKRLVSEHINALKQIEEINKKYS